jgi:hypothetical protein
LFPKASYQLLLIIGKELRQSDTHARKHTLNSPANITKQALLWAICLIALLPCGLLAAAFEDDFIVVFIDAQTEAKYGAFPLDRGLIADAIDELAAAKAKGVVLKFFYDQPKDAASDGRLAKSLTKLPVALQARLDETEAKPNPLPVRFTLPTINAETAVSGLSGWIPLPLLAGQAKAIGFVDFSSATVPMLETYQGQTVKSLILCSIELATGKPASITPGKSLSFGEQSLRLDSKNQITAKLPKTDALKYIPFHTLLDKSTPASALAGKVVIIGYDGSKIHSLETSLGKVKAHRLFVYSLKGVYEQMRVKP